MSKCHVSMVVKSGPHGKAKVIARKNLVGSNIPRTKYGMDHEAIAKKLRTFTAATLNRKGVANGNVRSFASVQGGCGRNSQEESEVDHSAYCKLTRDGITCTMDGPWTSGAKLEGLRGKKRKKVRR